MERRFFKKIIACIKMIIILLVEFALNYFKLLKTLQKSCLRNTYFKVVTLKFFWFLKNTSFINVDTRTCGQITIYNTNGSMYNHCDKFIIFKSVINRIILQTNMTQHVERSCSFLLKCASVMRKAVRNSWR